MVPPPGYMAGVREICDKYGIVMIADEVMSGFGRSGKWFAINHFDVVPDLLTFAKGVNSGYVPLAAQLACTPVVAALSGEVSVTIAAVYPNGTMLVRGEKRQEQETKDGGFHRVERSYGSFQRALNLPADANQDTIKAAFKNGVLTITMEKREASTPKQGRSIPING